MQIGVDSFSFRVALMAGEYDVFQSLERLVELGVAGVQINIRGENGRFLGSDPTDAEHVRAVHRALEALGLFCEVGGYSTRPEELEPHLRLAAELGADLLRTLLVFQNTPEETFERARRDLEKVLPLARELSMRIAVENHEDVTSQELRDFVVAMDDPLVGVCLDSGNDLVVYDDLVRGAELLAPYAFTTHIKDQKLVRVGGEVFSVGVPFGEGDLDLPSILKVIEQDSPLDRVMVQDCWGYSVPLNPFGRADLVPSSSYEGLPEYATREEAAADGLLLELDDFDAAQLAEYAPKQDEYLEHDVAYVRALLS